MSSVDILLAPSPVLYHPAFDIQDGIMVIGFRPSRGQRDIVRVVSNGSAVVVDSGEALKVAGVDVRFEERKREALPALEGQWRSDDVSEFRRVHIAPSGAELYARLRSAVGEYVDFDDEGKYVIVICMIALTYVYPIFASIPFLHVLGEKGTGKSQTLDMIQQLARAGEKTRATPAVIGDLVESRRPTLIMDQADNLTDQHVDLLADSYRAGSRRTIVDMNHRGVPLEFATFGPKAFAGTKPLPDDLADRAILITTVPSVRQLRPVRVGDPLLSGLRHSLYRFSLLHFAEIAASAPLRSPGWSGLQGLSGRQRDLFLPIEVLMEIFDVREAERASARAYYARSQLATKAELDDDTHRLIHVLVRGVGAEEEWVTTSDELLAQLGGTGSAWIDTDEDIWTSQKLGKRLQSLAVVKHRARVEGNHARQYIIDGNAVRSLAQRFGISG